MNQMYHQRKKVLEAMPDVFTSHEFGAFARREGYYDIAENDGTQNVFLKQHCEQLSKYRWQKKSNGNPVDKDFETECIEYLKGLGYKIFKMQEL